VRDQLLAMGANLRVYDSWVQQENNVASVDDAISGAKALLIVTYHDDCINQIKEINLVDVGIEVVVDGRNCLNGKEITRQGITYRGIGRR